MLPGTTRPTPTWAVVPLGTTSVSRDAKNSVKVHPSEWSGPSQGGDAGSDSGLMPARTAGPTVGCVRPPSWTSRDDGWFLRVAAAATALIGLLGAAVAAGPAARLEVGGLSAAAVVGYLVAARRRLPTVLLVAWTFTPSVLLALRHRGEGTMFLLVVAVSLVVLVEDDRWVRLVAGTAATLSPAVVQLLAPSEWGWPFWVGGILFGWLSAEQMRRFRALVAELGATRERLAVQAVHLERRRISAELHDLVGHSLGVLLLHVTGARRRLRDDPAGAEEALRQAESIGRSGLAEIRRSVAALRDEAGTAIAPMLTAADVPDLVERTAAAGCAVRLRVDGDLAAVESIIGLAVYRVVQESLANATRHAPGAAVAVGVDVRADAVGVSVRDTGGGGGGGTGSGGAGSGGAGAGGVGGTGGVGLVGMRERVAALGGALSAGPVAGGWEVRARLPRSGAPVPTARTETSPAEAAPSPDRPATGVPATGDQLSGQQAGRSAAEPTGPPGAGRATSAPGRPG